MKTYRSDVNILSNEVDKIRYNPSGTNRSKRSKSGLRRIKNESDPFNSSFHLSSPSTKLSRKTSIVPSMSGTNDPNHVNFKKVNLTDLSIL